MSKKKNILAQITSQDISSYPDQASYKINQIVSALSEESDDREKGDEEGSAALQAEREARIASDQALGERIDEEAETRATDDTSLQNQIDAISGEIGGLIDLFYPVGSYYETSNLNFNPNTAWGGTWVLDSQGRVTVSQTSSGTFATVGGTGGAETVTIASNNLPTHTHTYAKANSTTGSHTLTIAETPAHTHTRGTMEISGYYLAARAAYAIGQVSGAFTGTKLQGSTRPAGENGTGDISVNFKASNGWTGETSSVGGGTGHNHTISTTSTNSGNGEFSNNAMTNLQPYLVVKRWHRTA